ncbi:MAG: polysaccharide biosynthesis C-terminal domain-containing protein, partial [Clostridia bacterium]|nr:polysaccharide biosynthesis C-terminal domain-containing protein [Clostridia bacterium]
MQKSKYFGDRGFYKYVLGLAIPIIIQNFITNFLSMLDNLMVGTLGTASMSGVSVANQFLFVYMLAIFGLVSGAGIFGAQYAGNNDPDGLRNAFRFKVAAGLLLTFLFCWLYAVQNEFLIGLYLKGDGDPALRAETLAVAKKYMLIMLVGLYPAAMTQAYASTLRETGQTKVPMAASMTGVLVNLIGDYVLIFGKFGAPRLEVAGAAIATVFARFVELAFLIIWTHTHTSSGLISFASK